MGSPENIQGRERLPADHPEVLGRIAVSNLNRLLAGTGSEGRMLIISANKFGPVFGEIIKKLKKKDDQ